MTTTFPKVLHRPRFGKKRAFTLLELVIALVVLGILAALAVPTYLTVIDKAKVPTATAVALSVTDDAIAIASGTNSVVTHGNVDTAVAETHGVSLATCLLYTSDAADE